jgi:DNA invertase Pin-like site-specific DNA recombinase
MNGNQKQRLRCAIYTRKSSEEGLDQDFNSLHAQREACEAYVRSQQHEGWVLVATQYDDGGFSGGNMKRPALVQLMNDMASGLIDIVLVYKVDRLSRSLADFARIVESFDRHDVSFVSITQQFNTSTSMGRLTLNVLLSFAQFEREVTGERIRDKIAASKKKGMWMGGTVPPGYKVKDRALVINETEAETVRSIYRLYCELKSVKLLKEDLDRRKVRKKPTRRYPDGCPWSRGGLYTLLKNPIYVGKIPHKGKIYPGQHPSIIDNDLWDKAQKILSRNRHNNYRRTHVKEPSLLAGFLFDEDGHPFSLAHTRRGSRRYRYYVNQAKIQFKQTNPEALFRVPAHAVESVVESVILRLLASRTQISSIIKPLSLTGPEQESLLKHARELSKDWKRIEIHQKIDFLTVVLKKIILQRTEIIIEISSAGFIRTLLPDHAYDQSNESFEIRMPVNLKRCGVETKLIVSQPAADQALTPHGDSIRAIQKALQNAILWNNALLSVTVKSSSDLAIKNNVSQRYVAQIIKLAYLSPRLMQRIYDEDIPHDLTLGKLKAQLSSEWKHQEKLFAPRKS